MNIKPISITFAALVLLSAPVFAADPAESRTAALIDAFKQVHPVPESGTLEAQKIEENKATFSALDGFFALDTFVEATVTPSLAAFTPEQLNTFRTTFMSLVRLVAYPDSGAFLRTATYTLKVLPPRGGKVPAQVDITVPEEDLEVVVTFLWSPGEDGELRIDDVLFDGESLVLEYQNQFKRIIDKKGVQELLDKLQARHDEIRMRSGI